MTSLFHSRTKMAWLLTGFALLLLLVPTSTRAQLIDAGGQANLMHQHALMRQQSGTDEPGQFKRPVKPVHQKATHQTTPQHMAEGDNLASLMARRREALRPEYLRRVARDGQVAADAWLRKRATQLGREDGHAAKVGGDH